MKIKKIKWTKRNTWYEASIGSVAVGHMERCPWPEEIWMISPVSSYGNSYSVNGNIGIAKRKFKIALIKGFEKWNTMINEIRSD